MQETNQNTANLASFIWKNADDLWGKFKHTDFGKIILPFTMLRRLECVLEPTRQKVRDQQELFAGSSVDIDMVLRQTTQYPFYNTSHYSLDNLGATKTAQNLEDYVAKFSENARRVFAQFDFGNTVSRLDKAGALYKICQNFGSIDLHPSAVNDRAMSNLYEELIRKFGAEVNEGAEDFMTPRDIVHLATSMLLDQDDALFQANPGLIRTLYYPTCGTGGFLTDAMTHIDQFSSRYEVPPVLVPHGQELEPETHAVCMTSMLLRTLESDPGRDLSANIKLGSTLSNDQFEGERFHYILSNPPFGKKWEDDQTFVLNEHKDKGFKGRFGAGLPRVSDGSMLFMQHVASKLETPEEGGGRAAIVLSGSPLFTGGAGSGESEIRRWLLENDLVEAIVALPEQIFFRTGIGTYLWILSNKKPQARKGKVQLIDATKLFNPMRKNEGNKRREIGEEARNRILQAYANFEQSDISKIFDYREFGYARIKVLRPLRMSIHVNAQTLDKLQAEKAWLKLTAEQQKAWLEALQAHMDTVHPHAWMEATTQEIAKANPVCGKASKAFVKLLTNALGVRDPEGEVVVDAQGKPIEDPELTDFENVPLSRTSKSISPMRCWYMCQMLGLMSPWLIQ